MTGYNIYVCVDYTSNKKVFFVQNTGVNEYERIKYVYRT